MRSTLVLLSLIPVLHTGCALEPADPAIGERLQEGVNQGGCDSLCCDPDCNLQSTDLVGNLNTMYGLFDRSLAMSSTTDDLNIQYTDELETSPDGRNVIRHLVGCALSEGDRIAWTEPATGVEYEWFGLHGIAPIWRNNGIPLTAAGEAAKDQLGNCMLSYINDNGASVRIEADSEIWGDGASGDYMLQGGAFMGTLSQFYPGDGADRFFSCYSLPKKLKNRLGDAAEDTRDCPYPNSNCEVQSLGFCGEVCASKSGLNGEWGDCLTPDGVMENPAWVNLKASANVEQIDCQPGISTCVAHSIDKLIARATLIMSAADFKCKVGDDCAFYAEGVGTASIVASNNANMAASCSMLPGAFSRCDVECNDIANGVSKTECQITISYASTAGTIECNNEASCRLTCLDNPDHSKCKFDVCGDPAGMRECPGYPNSKFCGECPGTCLETSPADVCDSTGPIAGRSCQCDPECNARGDCCENKFTICGID